MTEHSSTLNRALFRKAAAWPAAHGFYIVGDLAARVLNRIPDWEAKPVEKIASGLYWIYNRSMLLSADINDWGGLKLWK